MLVEISLAETEDDSNMKADCLSVSPTCTKPYVVWFWSFINIYYLLPAIYLQKRILLSLSNHILLYALQCQTVFDNEIHRFYAVL
jgi:hypothetical protein